MIDRRKMLELSSAALAGGAIALISGCTRRDGEPAGQTVRFASPTPVWWNAVPLIAQRHGLYARQHVDVEAFDVPTGVKAKEAITQGNADMGVAATNAFTVTNPADLQKIKILASIMQSDATVSIVSRRPLAEIETLRIGYVRNAISHFYLISYLQQQNMLELYNSGRLHLVELAPPALVSAFDGGDVDAISAWEPFASQAIALARHRTGQAPYVVRDPSLYTQHIFAVASSPILASPRRREVDLVLAALRGSCEYIEAHRAEVGAELEHFFTFPSGFLTGPEGVWAQVHFQYSTDRAMMEAALRRDFALAQLAGPTVAQAGSEANLLTVLSELR